MDLGNGYELTAQQVDIDGKQVWIDVSKDGKFLENNVFDLDNDKGYDVWTYDEDVGGEDDVVVMKVNVTSVFQGQTDSLAQIEGLWMIDWKDYIEIDSDDEREELERTQSSASTYLKYWNTDDISLDKDDTIHIADEMYFQTADNDTLRYYPYVEMTIEGGDVGTPDEGTPDVGTPDEGTPDEGTPDEGTPDVGTPDEGTPDEGTPDEGTPDEGTPDEDTPGFEAVLAIGGLLAVAYLVRRN
jgi:PGF-CTERM protein